MKCKTKGCNNKAIKYRKICYTCKTQMFRKNNPLKYLFYNLRSNAKRRGKNFTLTYQEFEKFALESGYCDHHGREANCLSVDRINPLLGYHKDNIRAITVSDNVKLERGTLVIDDPNFQQTDYVPF